MLDHLAHSCTSALAFALALVVIGFIAFMLERAIHLAERKLGRDGHQICKILRTTALGLLLLDCGVLSWFATTTAMHAVGL